MYLRQEGVSPPPHFAFAPSLARSSAVHNFFNRCHLYCGSYHRLLVTGRVYAEKHSLFAPTSANDGLLMSLQSASRPLVLNLEAALVSRGRTHKALQIFDEVTPGYIGAPFHCSAQAGSRNVPNYPPVALLSICFHSKACETDTIQFVIFSFPCQSCVSFRSDQPTLR